MTLCRLHQADVTDLMRSSAFAYGVLKRLPAGYRVHGIQAVLNAAVVEMEDLAELPVGRDEGERLREVLQKVRAQLTDDAGRSLSGARYYVEALAIIEAAIGGRKA